MDLVMKPYQYLGKLWLVALLVSESYSEHTSELNGFEGQEFTFTCPEGHNNITWYKGHGTGGERIGNAAADFNVQECSLPGCTIRLYSGDLKIPSLSLDDEGWYTCKRSGYQDDFENHLHYVKVNVYVEATNDSMDMTEIKFPFDGQPFDIECTVDRIKPRPVISFKFLDSDFQPDEEVVKEIGDGTIKIIARIQKTFQHSDEGYKFRCVVQPPPGKGMEVVKQKVVYLASEYSTSVTELDQNEKPMLGSQKTLKCVVKTEGKPQADSVRWLLNGLLIRGSAKYSGSSSMRLTIKDLVKTDKGEYRCKIDNSVGPGKSLGGYDLQVWYQYISYFEYVSELHGFEGREFTFTCPEGNEPIFWYKGNGTQGETIGIAAADLKKQECSLPDCTIQLGSGDLRIPSLSLDDEGWYTCKKSGHHDDFKNMLHYVKVNVYLEATEDSMDMTEIKFPVDGQPFDIECTVDHITPRPVISFKFLDSDFQPDEEEVELLGDGTMKIIARIQKTFQRSDEGNEFICVVQPLPGKGMKVVKQKVVYLASEYRTSVTEVDQNEIPNIARQKTLECVVEAEGEPQADSVRWLHNGLLIRGSAKYSGSSSMRLTIKDLVKTDKGKYRCKINNSAGPGKSVGEYDLQVWYPYTSYCNASISKQDGTPLLGADLLLICNPDKSGFPPEVNGINWYRGIEMILEGDKYEYKDKYGLKVKNLEKYADNGEYTCTIDNPAGEGHSSRRYSLETLWSPAGQPTIQPIEMTSAIGSDITLSCGGSFDRGNPVANFTIWTKTDNETFRRNVTGTILILENLQTVRAAGHYQCQAGNLYGQTDLSTVNEVNVEAPLFIEHPISPTSKTFRWNDGDFELSCTISGSNIAQYTWKKDGQALDEQFFDYLPLETVRNSNFSYGQTKAQKSVIKREIEGYEFTCKNVEYFNGDYTCHPQGSMAGKATTAVSQPITVTTQYKAFWAGQDKWFSALEGDRNISILCDVCSFPKVNSFQWTFDGKPLRNGIGKFGAMITLDEVKPDDFGNYTCKTETIINDENYTSEFDIELQEKGPPYPPRDFRVTSRTSKSVNLTWTPGHAAGYAPLTFGLELKIAADVGYKLIRGNISENDIFLDQLFPFTEYSVRIQAFNQRPEEKGPNYSDQVELSFRTRIAPNISMYSVVVKETEMTISWNYVPLTQKDWATEEDYQVEVLIEYKEQNKHHFETYPANGSLLLATVGNVTIPGEYDIYSVYQIRLLTYENGIIDLVSKPEPFSTVKKRKDDPLLLLLLKVGLPILVLGIFGIVGITSIFYCRRSNRQRKQNPLKLAPSRHELDNITQTTSDPNRNKGDWQAGYEVPVSHTEEPTQIKAVYEEIPHDVHRMTASLNNETNELENISQITSDTNRNKSDWHVGYKVPVDRTEGPTQIKAVYEEIPEDVNQMTVSLNNESYELDNMSPILATSNPMGVQGVNVDKYFTEEDYEKTVARKVKPMKARLFAKIRRN